MTQYSDHRDEDRASATINELSKQAWKELKALLQEVPLEERIERWKQRYEERLIEQFKWLDNQSAKVGEWHVVASKTQAVTELEQGYQIDQRFAELLADAALVNLDAFELASELIAANLEGAVDTPAVLRLLGAKVLRGTIQAPPKPAHRPTNNWVRDYLITEAIETARLMGINPTRNEATMLECGISLVHDALSEVWPDGISYDRVAKIWSASKAFDPGVSRLNSAIANLLQTPE